MRAKLSPFFLRVRVWFSLLSAWLLNLGMFGDKFKPRSFCNPGMNCHGCPWSAGACPIGVFAYSSAVHTLPTLAISMVIVMTLFLGRLTCAFLCPFGLLQDLLYKIPFFKFKLPRWTRYLKYAALLLLVFLLPFLLGFQSDGYMKVSSPQIDKADAAENGEPQVKVKVTLTNVSDKPISAPQIDFRYVTADQREIFRESRTFAELSLAPKQETVLPEVLLPNKLQDGNLIVSSPQAEIMQTSPYELYYCRLCPVGTLEATLPAMAGAEQTGMSSLYSGKSVKLGILIFFLVLMLIVSRPFCRTFCPMGAIYALFARFALARMELEPGKCTECGLCDKVCPVDLKVSKEVGGMECIACGDCRKVCPQSGISRKFGL